MLPSQEAGVVALPHGDSVDLFKGRLAAERGERVVRIVLGVALTLLALRYLGVLALF